MVGNKKVLETNLILAPGNPSPEKSSSTKFAIKTKKDPNGSFFVLRKNLTTNF
jgi:hypothetical protein